jgi:GNAT superfamily N-acetyltransferase
MIAEPLRRPIASRKTHSVDFRKAEAGDETAIAEVLVLTWQAAYRGMVPDDQLDGLSVPKRTAVWQQIISELDPPAQCAIVALDGPQLLGFVHFCPSRDPNADPEVGEITAIYVHPDHWGEGTGRGLLQHAVESLSEAGFASCTLWVLDGNERARRFYEEAGWVADGLTKQDERDGFTLNEVRYTRPI